jgi:hypothetical protein
LVGAVLRLRAEGVRLSPAVYGCSREHDGNAPGGPPRAPVMIRKAGLGRTATSLSWPTGVDYVCHLGAAPTRVRPARTPGVTLKVHALGGGPTQDLATADECVGAAGLVECHAPAHLDRCVLRKHRRLRLDDERGSKAPRADPPHMLSSGMVRPWVGEIGLHVVPANVARHHAHIPSRPPPARVVIPLRAASASGFERLGPTWLPVCSRPAPRGHDLPTWSRRSALLDERS